MINRKFNGKKHAVRGVGMVELLVALVLSSLVSIVVIQLFIQNKVGYLQRENISRLQENGRYALQLITRAIRSADYWGCIPTFKDSGVESIDDVGINITGLTSPTEGVTGTNGATGTNDAGYPTLTDTITISGLQGGRTFPIADTLGMTLASDNIIIDVGSLTNTGIQPNDLLVVSDCSNADVFQVTNNPDATISGGVATIQHGTTPAAAPPTTFANANPWLSTNYGDTASVYTGFVADVQYTIVDDDHDGDGGAGTAAIPTLARVVGGAITPLVPGVENIQIVFGVDTDTDGQPDRYVSPDQVTVVADWEAVVTARISILVRSPDARNDSAYAYTMEGQTVAPGSITAEANGKFPSRRVFSTTITLRNRAS